MVGGSALAHDYGVSFSRVELSAGSVFIEMSINADELPPAVRLDDNGDGFIEEAEVLVHEREIQAFFERGLKVNKEGRACAPRCGPVTYVGETSAAEATIRFDCASGAGVVQVHYPFVPAILHPHRNVATIVLGSQQRSFLYSAEQSSMTVRLVGDELGAESAARAGPGSLAWSGSRGAVRRVDTLALALCFLASPVAALLALAVGICCGALAAAQGLVSAPATALSAVSALTIAYLAFENLLGKSQAASRWMLALPVGLLHGIGAAQALSLAVDARVLPWAATLAFSLATGLTVALLALGLGGLRRQLRGRVDRRGWALMVGFGLCWFAFRAFDLQLPFRAAPEPGTTVEEQRQ